MNKTLVLIFCIFTILGFAATIYSATILGFVGSFGLNTQSITSLFHSAVTKIQGLWATMPSNLQPLILTGVPTAFMMFFAWTKTRAMNKLQQVQQESTQQITQLTGESNVQAQALTQYQTELADKQKQITELKQQLANTADNTAYADLQKQYLKLQDNQNATIQSLREQIAELKVMKEVLEAKLRVA